MEETAKETQLAMVSWKTRESHGQRSLAGHSHKELDMTEWLNKNHEYTAPSFHLHRNNLSDEKVAWMNWIQV